jgi:magnesium transporter
MIRSLYRTQDGQVRTGLEASEFAAAIEGDQGLLWVDLVEEPTAVCEPMLEHIFDLKRALLHLRRIMAPQREVLNRLARGDYIVVGSGDRPFFRDVYDHLVRLYDISEGLRDLVSGALDTYLSVVNNRMNEVMKTLTVITTLFMPLSFLVGFFGMNFFEVTRALPAWTSRPAFFLVPAAMLVTPMAMYLWMRRRAWM